MGNKENQSLDEKIKQYRKQFITGTTIKLIHMEDRFTPVPSGTIGKVRFVDDVGTVHMNWNNGSSLGLIPETDQFEILDGNSSKDEPDKRFIQNMVNAIKNDGMTNSDLQACVEAYCLSCETKYDEDTLLNIIRSNI